jgi:hypothetical protein
LKRENTQKINMKIYRRLLQSILTCSKHALHSETICNSMNAIIKALLGFYFTRLTPRYKINNSPLLGKREGKQRNERVTPEFGGY